MSKVFDSNNTTAIYEEFIEIEKHYKKCKLENIPRDIRYNRSNYNKLIKYLQYHNPENIPYTMRALSYNILNMSMDCRGWISLIPEVIPILALHVQDYTEHDIACMGGRVFMNYHIDLAQSSPHTCLVSSDILLKFTEIIMSYFVDYENGSNSCNIFYRCAMLSIPLFDRSIDLVKMISNSKAFVFIINNCDEINKNIMELVSLPKYKRLTESEQIINEECAKIIISVGGNPEYLKETSITDKLN